VDVTDLRDFYATPFGRFVRLNLSRRVRQIWPDMMGQRLLGLGFATPYLTQYSNEAERMLAVMVPKQGVMHWPNVGPRLVTLAEEDALPLPDRAVDRLLMVHCLENSTRLQHVLRECWRVLTDGGRILVVVPNRRGLWARIERTPFATGTPYSKGQLTRLLEECLFVPTKVLTALSFPPLGWRPFQSWATAIEAVGARWFSTFAGVVLVECTKQIYSTPMEKALLRTSRDYVITPGAAGNKLSRTQYSAFGIEQTRLVRSKDLPTVLSH